MVWRCWEAVWREPQGPLQVQSQGPATIQVPWQWVEHLSSAEEVWESFCPVFWNKLPSSSPGLCPEAWSVPHGPSFLPWLWILRGPMKHKLCCHKDGINDTPHTSMKQISIRTNIVVNNTLLVSVISSEIASKLLYFRIVKNIYRWVKINIGVVFPPGIMII